MNRISNFFQTVYSRNFLSYGLILFVLFSIIFGYGIFSKKTDNTTDNLPLRDADMEIDQALSIGDYGSVVEVYDYVLSKTVNESTRQKYTIYRERARFQSGEEMNEQEAIRTLSSLVANAESDASLRALAVSVLVDFCYYDLRNEETIKYILTQEPWISDSRIDKDNTDKAILQIAQFGIALSPTFSLYLVQGHWYATHLLNSQSSPEITDEYVKVLRESIIATRSLSESEEIFLINKVRFLKALGFQEGILELKTGEHSDAFEQSYREALRLEDENPTNIPIREINLYTRFYYAALLQNLYGAERDEDIRTLLRTLVDRQASMTAREQRYFRSFLAHAREKSATSDDYFSRSFVSLANVSLEFKNWLNQNGWSI